MKCVKKILPTGIALALLFGASCSSTGKKSSDKPESTTFASQVEPSWKKALHKELKKLDEAELAALKKQIWKTDISVALDNQGRVQSLQVAKSSGSPLLDRVALESLQGGDHYAKPPRYFMKDGITQFKWRFIVQDHKKPGTKNTSETPIGKSK